MEKSQEELSIADVCIEVAKSKRKNEIETINKISNRIINKIAEVNNDVKFIKEIINKHDNYLDIEHIKRKI